MILLPEQRLKALMDFFLESINEGYLEKLFGNQTFGSGGYNYFDNAKEIFLRRKDSPRKVVCNLFFNRERQGLPTIHIALNQDIPGEANGLGMDPQTEVNAEKGTYTENLTRAYSSRFNIICTSDNTFEVLIVYNVIRALMQGNPALLDAAGLYNCKFSGQDLILTDYLMPTTIYARGFMLDCLYDVQVPPFSLGEGGESVVRRVFVESLCGKQIEVTDNE